MRWIMGTAALGGQAWGQQDPAVSMNTLAAAWDLDVRDFDTAHAFGESEAILGRFLKGRTRDRFRVSTKAAAEKDPESLAKSLARSLELLGLEYVDTCFIEWPDNDLDLRPHLSVMERLRRDGRIRRIGVSNFSPQQIAEVCEAGRVDVCQDALNLLWRYRIEDVLAFCKRSEIEFQAYGVLAQGLLTSKFNQLPKFADGDDRGKLTYFRSDNWSKISSSVEAMFKSCARHGVSLGLASMKWVRWMGADAAIVGVRTPAQARQFARMRDYEVPRSVLEEIETESRELAERMRDTGSIYALVS